MPSVEKMQLVTQGDFSTGWTVPVDCQCSRPMERPGLQGGHSFAGYIENVSVISSPTLHEQERQLVLAGGVKSPTSACPYWPTAGVSGPDVGPDSISGSPGRELDGEPTKRLRIGICAVSGAAATPIDGLFAELFETNRIVRADCDGLGNNRKATTGRTW